jgi:Rab guanine nucleotide exchange factor SEC2
MVAEARFARSISERKVEEAERALKGTEEAVAVMQRQMQILKAEKEQSEKSAENVRAIMGKGKWVERSTEHSSVATPSLRLISSHLPYQEFLLFVAHLRSIHPSSPSPPAMTTLLSLPFLARLLAEDSYVDLPGFIQTFSYSHAIFCGQCV